MFVASSSSKMSLHACKWSTCEADVAYNMSCQGPIASHRRGMHLFSAHLLAAPCSFQPESKAPMVFILFSSDFDSRRA